jgi:hypothetical protein
MKKGKHMVCSYECLNILKSTLYKKDGNHQYGLTGELNSSFKGGERITFWGYNKIYSPNHPFCDSDNYVLEHRLIAEKYLLNNENSVIVNGVNYLNPICEVHHKDFNRLNIEPAAGPYVLAAFVAATALMFAGIDYHWRQRA